MGTLQRLFPRIFGPDIPAKQVEKAAETAGQLFGDPNAKTEAYGLLAGVLPFGQPPKRGTRELLMLYSASPWLRAVVGRIALPVASTTWEVEGITDRHGKFIKPKRIQRAWGDTRRQLTKDHVRAGKGSVVSMEEHPLLDFLAAGCPAMDARTVMALTQIYLDLVGQAYWLIERWDSGPLKGKPRYAWPIPPLWVQMTPTVTSPSYQININGWYVNIPETEIVAFKDPDPAQPYGRGSGIAESLADELGADENASKLVNESFYQRNLPAAVVSMEGGSKDEAERTRMEWSQRYRGVFKAFQTHFTNSKISVHQLSQSFVDMQVLELRKQMRDTFLEVYGYPKELMGILDNANRSTIDTAAFRKEKYVVEPRRELFRHVFQFRLMPEYDERGLVGYVNTVPEDSVFILEVMKVRPSAYSENDVRKLTGHDPIPGPDGDKRPELGTQPAPPTKVPEVPPADLPEGDAPPK